MSSGGDRARVTVHVKATPSVAFRVFTEDIDRWWRRGLRYRALPSGLLQLERRSGGRLFELCEGPDGARVHECGRVVAWEPPRRLAFEWRARNFEPGETTLVEVEFVPRRGGTEVTLTHSGFSRLRPDHPVRHGMEPVDFVRMMGLWWGDLMTSLREQLDGALLSE